MSVITHLATRDSVFCGRRNWSLRTSDLADFDCRLCERKFDEVIHEAHAEVIEARHYAQARIAADLISVGHLWDDLEQRANATNSPIDRFMRDSFAAVVLYLAESQEVTR